MALLPTGMVSWGMVTSLATPAISPGLVCDKPRWGICVCWSSSMASGGGHSLVPPWLPHVFIININQLVVWVTWDFSHIPRAQCLSFCYSKPGGSVLPCEGG